MPKKPTRARTVAAELRRRKDCRYGLRGVRIRLLGDDSGAEYVCAGSGWDQRGQLQLDLVPAERWQEYCDAEPKGFITCAELMAYTPPAYLRRDVPADRCVLLSDWPEVCPCWK